jgi:hypothetical protein
VRIMDTSTKAGKHALSPPAVPGDQLALAALKVRNLAHALTSIHISRPAVARVLYELADELDDRRSRN